MSKGTVVKLNRGDVVFLLTKLGWGKASEKDNTWLLGKLKDLNKQVEDEGGIDKAAEGLTAQAKGHLAEILKANEDGADFDLGDADEKKETAQKPPPKRAPSKTKKGGHVASRNGSNGHTPHPPQVVSTKTINIKDIIANIAQPRAMGALSELWAKGYGLFEPKEKSDLPAIIPMLLSKNEEDREKAVDLIEEYEPTIAALAGGQEEFGQLQAIGAREYKDGYDVIYGMQRVIAKLFMCAKDSKIEPKVEAKIYGGKITEVELLLMALDENNNRKDESPIDRAMSYKRLIDRGVELDEVAERTHQSTQSVRNYLLLLHKKLEDKRMAIHTGRLPVRRALKLLVRRKHGEGEIQKVKKGRGRHRLPSAVGILKIYEAKDKPEKMSDKEWKLWVHPAVRRFLAYKLGFKFTKAGTK